MSVPLLPALVCGNAVRICACIDLVDVCQLDSLCRYAKTLDAAVHTNRIGVVVSVIDELASREGLKNALKDRTAESLVPLLKFLAKYLAHPQYSKVAMSTVGLCVDLHVRAFLSHPELAEILTDVRSRVIAELRLQRELKALSGVLEMLTAV